MQPTQPLSYPINDFFSWYKRDELILQPKFQRRPVWSEKARSYLIDTIIRQLPVPKLYMRQRIDLVGRRTVREIVDGQQRLRAVFDFLDGKFPILKTHNHDYGGLYFHQFSDDVKNTFLSYRFSVDLLEGASDTEILDIFSRLNSYTITLNSQEKLNAKYFGQFKQCIYKLGFDHYNFWLNNKIMTDLKIARMSEAELVSELVIAMLDGLQSGKKTIEHFYKKYDEEFRDEENVIQRFQTIIDLISGIFSDGLARTSFRRIPLFYSLFLVLYNARYGLPRSTNPKLNIPQRLFPKVRDSLLKLDADIKGAPSKPELVEFTKASSRGTTNLDSRKLRHRIIWEYVIKATK
jgi:hypothetical protein